MARVTFVKSARASKKERRCVRCGYVIQPGESYRHAGFKTSPYSSMVRNWCKDHPPRQSELTMNDRLSRLYAAQEAISDAKTIDDIACALDDAADTAEEVRDDYQESHDNMPESLQYSSTAEELESKVEACDTWADALRQAANEVRDLDTAECAECSADEDAEAHNEDSEEFDHEFEGPDVNAAMEIAEAASGELEL